MNRTKPTYADLGVLAKKHLYYEVAMLRGSLAEHQARRLRFPGVEKRPRDDADRIACMAFFETSLLHARVLNDFLTIDPSGRGKSDDVWAGDYIPGWQPPATAPLDRVSPVLANGRPVRESINKQLAHFSLERVTQSKFWFPAVVDEVLVDLNTFAEDTANICYAELSGVRDLLNRSMWRTTA